MLEQKREVVHDIFINVHCLSAQARKTWVSTCIKDALEWFDYLRARSTLSPSQTVR